MKKRILAAFLLAGALVVAPIGGGFLSTVASASSNSTVSSEVSSAIGNVTTANAVAKASYVRRYGASGIGEAMVSGETALVDKITELEEAYKEALGIADTTVSVSGVEGVDASSVKVLGAAINTTNTSGASLSIRAAAESVDIPSGYSNAHVLEISMEGLNMGGCPMMITMPVPSGMDINKVVVLHYVTRYSSSYNEAEGRWESASEIVPEELTTANNGDGTISFYVTHFSFFAFVESDGTSSGDGDFEEAETVSSLDEQEELQERIINAASGEIIKVKGVISLSNATMKELLKRGDVTLVMQYSYEGVGYVITIPAGAAENNDISWYGPLYLSAHYRNGAAVVKGANGASYTVQSGDTMSRIASANGMTLGQLAAKNPQVKNLDYIVVGQKINLK